MPNTGSYNGNAGNFDPTTPFTTNEPVSGNPRSSSSIREFLRPLADAVEWFRQKVARKDAPNTFLARQTINAGAVGEDTPVLSLTATATTWQFMVSLGASGLGAGASIYRGANGVLALVTNAIWNPTSGKWGQINNTLYSTILLLDQTNLYGSVGVGIMAPGTPAWTSWSAAFSVGNDAVRSYKQVVVSGTSLDVGTTIQAGDDISTNAGNLTANGDPANDEARLRGKQLVMAGSAPTGSKGNALDNGAGDGAVAITGNDARGLLTFVTGAAVNGTSGQAISVVTFDKSYPAAPVVILQPTNANAANLATQPYVSATASGFTIAIGATPLNAGGTSYGWAYQVLG